MRIALTSVHCWPDVRRGGERYVHELAAALRRAGHDVTVLSTGQAPGAGEVLGVPVRRLPVRRAPARWFPAPWSDLSVEAAFGAQALAHLAGPVARGRFDVWHATSTGDAAAATLAQRLHPRLRTVFTDHGFPARRSREQRPDRRLHRRVVRHVDAYVCVSRAAAGFLEGDYGRAAAVVPPGVRWAEHRPLPRHPRPAVLYAGSLTEPRKGLPLLLDAVARLRARVPDAELWLHGPGDPAEALAGASDAARAAVTRCGALDDEALREAYARAWTTVLPSRAESFGMTVVESLASGTPAVVLADGGGPAEVVADDRVGRRAPGTPDGLAEAVAQVLALARDPATVAACRERARCYDWDEAVVPALERVYAGGRP